MESKAKLVGHPIHPMLIPFPLGLLGMAVVFALIHLGGGPADLARSAAAMIAAGVVTGLLAAVFGAVDWASIPTGTRAKGVATADGVGNVVVVALFAVARVLRRDAPADAAGAPIALEAIGVLGATVTAWLGGELVGHLGVGGNPGAHLNASNSLGGGPAR